MEKRVCKVVSSEGGDRERLINHSDFVIDFLLKGLSQTLNYLTGCRFVCVCCTVFH